MFEKYIYDKQLIKINAVTSIMIESKSTKNSHNSNIYANINNNTIHIGYCNTNKSLSIFEWMEYNDRFIALFYKNLKDNCVKITKLFDINMKEFVAGDEISLYNTYFKKKNSKIKRKK